MLHSYYYESTTSNIAE